MKTAISLPDPIFDEAERLARRLGKSRSQLYVEALTEYLRRHDADTITAAYDRVSDAVDPALDPALDAAGRKVLAQVEW